MATTTLNLYWDLASLDATVRQQATVTLIRTLVDFQLAHEKSLDNNSTTSKVAGTEEELDQVCASDVSYAVRRLLRGLPSSRQGARQGFSLALTELLAVMDCITAPLVMDLLCEYTERAGGMSGEEVRDMLFGRLFGIMAMVASGLLARSTTEPAHVIRMIDLVSEIANAKAYLNEVCYHVIINMLPFVEKMQEKDMIMEKILSLFVRENMANVDEVNLVLSIQQQMTNVDLSRAFKGWASDNVFDRANLELLASIVREVPLDNNENQADWTPQLHSIWDRLLPTVLSKKVNKNNASFHEFWSVVVDGNMFSQQSSHGRKYWGFQVMNKVLPQLSTDQMPLIFTENFMRTFINNLSSDVRFLNKAARQTAITIQQVAEGNKQVGFAVVSQLIGQYGHQQFDRITRTKTVENLLATMDADGIRHYLVYLARLFVNNQQQQQQGDDQVSERTIELQREWAINQMLLLVTHPKTPKEESWINDVVKFVLVYTFFDVKPTSAKKSNKKSSKATQDDDALTNFQAPTPVLTETSCTMLKSKFQALVLALSKLAPIKKTETGHLKTRRWNGSTNDGRLWADVIYNHYQTLLKKPTLTLRAHADPEAMEALDEAKTATLKVIDGLKSRAATDDNDGDHMAYGFEILFYHVLLHSLMDQEEGAGLLGDLLNCYEKMDKQQSAAASKKKNNKKKNATPAETAAGEPEPIEVIVDILLSFLTSASPMLKGITEHVFELFSPLLTKQAMENLINIIVTNENKQGGEELFGDEEDNSEEDDDVELLDGDDDDDVMEIDQDDESQDDEEDESDDEDQNGMVDEELRQKVEAAMRSQGILGGDDSDDEELLDDDAMEAFDEKLAEIFKQKKMDKQDKKTMQESVVHFKNNVMDLLMIFARKNPTNSLLLGTIVPLLQVVQSTKAKAKASTVQFVNKVESYLKNKLGKATEVPPYGTFDDATLLDIMRSIHTFATGIHGGGKAHSDMCSQLLLFVRKCIVGTGSDVTVDSLMGDKKTKAAGQLLQQYMDCYKASLEAFLTKKSNPLHTSYFVALLQRFPQTCWSPLMDTLVTHIVPDTCANTFRHSLACQWSGLLVQQCVGKKTKSVDQVFTSKLLPTMIQHIESSANKLLLDSTITGSHEKMKSLMKLAGLLDKTSSRLGSKITTWDASLFTTLSTDKTFGTPLIRTTCKSILDRS